MDLSKYQNFILVRNNNNNNNNNFRNEGTINKKKRNLFEESSSDETVSLTQDVRHECLPTWLLGACATTSVVHHCGWGIDAINALETRLRLE